jgi:hypothetical protein
MADNTTSVVSHAQRPGGSNADDRWYGVQTNKQRRPISNEECEQAAAALRARQGLDNPTPQTIGQQYGISRDHALFLQRLEARVLELENEVKALRNANKLPHMASVERR